MLKPEGNSSFKRCAKHRLSGPTLPGRGLSCLYKPISLRSPYHKPRTFFPNLSHSIHHMVACCYDNEGLSWVVLSFWWLPNWGGDNFAQNLSQFLCNTWYLNDRTNETIHDRIREHTYAARKHDNTSAFGEHYANTHPNTTTPNITFKILKRTSAVTHYDYTSRKPTPSKQNPPQLNRRDEYLGMGFLM